MLSRRLFVQLLAAGSLAAGALPAMEATARPGAPAPDFTGIDGWLNTPAPLTMAALRSRVVLVDFWTYSCINCRRTVPYLNRWQAEYGAKGLQVVGGRRLVHGEPPARRAGIGRAGDGHWPA